MTTKDRQDDQAVGEIDIQQFVCSSPIHPDMCVVEVVTEWLTVGKTRDEPNRIQTNELVSTCFSCGTPRTGKV